MAGRPRIVITVDSSGMVSAETRDILGDRCLDYVGVLEDLLTATAVSSAYTADHARTTTTVRQEDRDVERA
ncbi:DUF2997 domain-containing protein [Micromonospora zingiberis]|uniref:DUF2997 domain-containing protein n=1 Tax=Micromonospora zingiberis TaxID=2053011 RepID=A0A4V2LV14_9ACTN|nr:DUF2997 domain-containing protein [Micromonospora zingiberis]TCB90985.1 DUF2997 domain-containing protein [Micromonospora zingiberis]